MEIDQNHKKFSRTYGKWLIALLSLFGFRVGAQLLQQIRPVTFLPAFEKWQSGTIPYWVLVISQVIIFFVCLRTVMKFMGGQVHPNQKFGKFCIILGGVYLFVMIFRFAVGLTIAPEHSWFGATIPTFFHMVLASFLLMVGQFHFKHGMATQN